MIIIAKIPKIKNSEINGTATNDEKIPINEKYSNKRNWKGIVPICAPAETDKLSEIRWLFLLLNNSKIYGLIYIIPKTAE